MNSKLWSIVILIVSAVILLDVFKVITIGVVFEILLVVGLVIMLTVFIRSRKTNNGR